jgi:hypothetical protein
MHWRIRITAMLAMVVSLLSVSAQAAATLYAATGSGGVAGNLYVIDPNSGSASVAGPILLGATPVALTGLAVHPQTGVIYGATASSDATIPRHLVRITPTGAVTDIGTLGVSSADIAFSPAGILYMSSGASGNLFVVNLGSGLATSLGPTSFGSASGGGLAVTAGNIGLYLPNGASGVLATLNLTTGAGAAGPALTGAPIAGGTMNAASVNSTGVLYAVNGNFGGGVGNLVTINLTTGAVTNIGTLPPDIDALAFALGSEGVPTLSEWAMIVMALLLAATGFLAMRRRG